MDRKRSHGPAADEQGLGHLGEMLRAAFVAPDLDGGKEDLTRLMLHLSHEPREKRPKPAPPVEPPRAEPRKRRRWLPRRKPA